MPTLNVPAALLAIVHARITANECFFNANERHAMPIKFEFEIPR